MDINSVSNSRLKSFIENPRRALWTLAIPIMFGMGIQTMYNLVDMIFIGKLGGDAISGIAFNMPLFFLVLGLTMGLGTGVTASIARYIGQDNKRDADNAAEHAVFLALIISLTLTVCGLLFGKSLLVFFGAKENILNYSWDYLHIMCVGLPFMVFSGFFRSILAGEGDMKFPMMIAGLGTVINIILDPIFIFKLEDFGGFGLNLGIKGAALATAISQIIVFMIFIYMLFVKKHSYISFRLNHFRLSKEIFFDIIKVGFPASLSMVIMASGQGVFNKILVHFSSDTVAAYQVAGRLDMLVFLPIFSIAASLTTLVGMFYGAKKYDVLKYTVKYGITAAFLITTIASLIVFTFAENVIGFFTTDVIIMGIAVDFLRLFSFVYPLIAVAITSGRVLQGLGQGLPVLIITIIRVLGISAPLAIYFVFYLLKPVEWVWIAMMISVGFSFLIAIYLLIKNMRKISKESNIT